MVMPAIEVSRGDFNINELYEIPISSDEGCISVDSTDIPDIDLLGTMRMYGILAQEDVPNSITIYAKMEDTERHFGILAVMGNGDRAGLCVASDPEFSIFQITEIRPRRSNTEKYNHTEIVSGLKVTDPRHGKLLSHIFDVFQATLYKDLIS